VNTWIILAFRNLWRNKRRSLVTIIAVMLGFSAVNVFGGFTTYMFTNLRDAFIYAQANGHIQIAHEGYAQKGTTDPADHLISAQTYEMVQRIARTDPRIILAAGQLDITGNLETGSGARNLFIGKAMQPSMHKKFHANARTFERGNIFIAQGEDLTDENPYAIGVAIGVQDTLGLKLGDEVTLVAASLDNQMNVVDAVVQHNFDSAGESIKNKLISMPLALAQELYQTDKVGTINILLHDLKDVEPVKLMLEEELKGVIAKEKLVITTWDASSDMYRLTRKMFDMIFGCVFFILLIIVSMSVMNTMGMAILERTTEIGTLRALGLKRRGVIWLFAVEGAMLGGIGSALGLLMTVGIFFWIQAANLHWTPPTIGRQVPLEIFLVTNYLVVTFLFLGILTLAAAILPARRAARGGIVEALGHV